MERLYRIFTWVILAEAALVVTAFFMFLPLPAWLLIWSGLIFCGWRTILRRDAVVEPRRVSRVQSALIWCAVLPNLYLAFHLIAFRYAMLNYCCGMRSAHPVMFLLALGAIMAVIFRPFSGHVKGLGLGIVGLLCMVLISACVFTVIGSNFAWRGKHLPAAYVMPVEQQRRFFPENASDFEIEGGSGFLTFYANWSCKVSEKDFEAFRRKNGYRFVLDRTDVNEDPAVGPQAWHDDKDWERPYYFHNNRHANGGGLTLRYSVSERKLYGRYSNH